MNRSFFPLLLLWCSALSWASAQTTYNLYDASINSSTNIDYTDDEAGEAGTQVQHTISTSYDGSSVSTIVSNYLGSLAAGGSSGSGTYTAVFRTSAPGSDTIHGGMNATDEYNASKPADNNPPSNPDRIFNQVSGVGLPIVNVGLVNIVNVGGNDHFEFLIDINENDDAISIDELVIWRVSANDNISYTSPFPLIAADSTNPFDLSEWTADFENATEASNHILPGSSSNSFYETLINTIEGANNGTGQVLWSLDQLTTTGSAGSRTVTGFTDQTILVSEFGAGSGSGDMNVLLPVSTVDRDSLDIHNDRFMIWVKWGQTGTFASIDFGNNGGFEEFAYLRTAAGGNSLIPEPSTWIMGALLCLIPLGEYLRRRFLQSPA